MEKLKQIPLRKVELYELDDESEDIVFEIDLKRFRSKMTRIFQPNCTEDSLALLKENSEMANLEISLNISNGSDNKDILGFLEKVHDFKIIPKYLFLSASIPDLELPENVRHQTFIALDYSVKPAAYEKYFDMLAKKRFRGVSANVEEFKRSHVLLAQKFGLQFVISGIIHDRHNDLVENSKADIRIDC